MPVLTILHGCRTIQLTRGLNTLIDEADFEKVGHLKWHACWNRYVFYARRNVVTGSVLDGSKKWTPYFLHREITESPPKKHDVDHKNGDALDNRRLNLRIVTRMQNGRNRHRVSAKSSKFKGVCRGKNGTPWQANIRVNRKLLYLGCFNQERDAAMAYDRAAREHFGDHACTNSEIFGDY